MKSRRIILIIGLFVFVIAAITEVVRARVREGQNRYQYTIFVEYYLEEGYRKDGKWATDLSGMGSYLDLAEKVDSSYFSGMSRFHDRFKGVLKVTTTDKQGLEGVLEMPGAEPATIRVTAVKVTGTYAFAQ